MKSSSKIQTDNAKFPANLLPSLHCVKFVCPLCRGQLATFPDAYYCSFCEKKYILHDGIPDFRVFPDPFLSLEEDRKRTEIVLAALGKYDLKRLLEHYWSFSDITPANLRPNFVRSAMLGEERARHSLEVIDKNLENAPEMVVLEIGCGTGNFLASASERYKQIIGIDIAMRWLHVSRRRFMDQGIPVPPLVCCCAEFLPFSNESFDLIVASSTLEFVGDQQKTLTESARVLKKNGALYINTVNRFSIGRNPYAYLYGVGFLPSKWQAGYVRRRRGASYENVKLLSLGAIKRLVKNNYIIGKLALPDVNPLVLNEFSPAIRLQIKIYRALKKIPGFRSLLKRFGPGWDIFLRKRD